MDEDWAEDPPVYAAPEPMAWWDEDEPVGILYDRTGAVLHVVMPAPRVIGFRSRRGP